MVNPTALVASLAIIGSAQAVRLLGRVNPAKELTWPATGVSFNFQGTQVTINFSKVTGDNSLLLVVDGKATVIPNVSSNSITTPTLKNGKHTVELRKRSEASFGTLQFGGVTTKGTILMDTVPARRIEYIGDSITVGYGEAGVFPCVNTAALEDAPNTYAAMTARNLSSDYSLVAWSGRGLIRNYMQSTPDTSPLGPELWTRYGANDADNSYTFPKADLPQAVVVNLGTNDFSYLNTRPALNATAFQQAYAQFIKTIQSHYPSAELFLTSSPLLSDSSPTPQDAQHTTMVNAIQGAIKSVGSAKLHFVDFPSQSGQSIGCDYHPGQAEHDIMAQILIPAIKAVLKW